MQCLGVFRNCSHFTYSVLVVIPKRGTLAWPLTYLAEVTNELRHSPHTLTHLPIMKVEILKKKKKKRIIRAVCSVASNGSCVCSSRHVLEHYTCTVPCFHEVPTHGHFKCLPLTTFNFVKLHFSKAAHNYADSSEFLLYQCYQQLVYSKCILVTPVHCLYSTVKLVVHGEACG